MSGPLLRFIPNWDEIYWEYDRDRPSPRAWRKRSNEDYVSAYLEGDGDCFTSVEALEAIKPHFAIFRITAERLIALGNVRIEYKPLKDEPEGHAHVGIFGINRSRAEKLARDKDLAERAKGPGPPEVPPTAGEGDEGPRDAWRDH